MSIWTCLKCTARYSVGAPACPQCQSTEHSDDPDYTPALAVEASPQQPAAAQRGTKASQAADAAASPAGAGPAPGGETP